jgi:hypothetical protein
VSLRIYFGKFQSVPVPSKGANCLPSNTTYHPRMSDSAVTPLWELSLLTNGLLLCSGRIKRKVKAHLRMDKMLNLWERSGVEGKMKINVVSHTHTAFRPSLLLHCVWADVGSVGRRALSKLDCFEVVLYTQTSVNALAVARAHGTHENGFRIGYYRWCFLYKGTSLYSSFLSAFA